MKLGNATVDAVLDGEFTINRDFVYPGIAPERWKPYEHLLKDGTDVVNQLGGYLVRTDDYVALIDTGFGPSKVPDWNAGAFLDSLETLGVKPDDVTDVLFTHLHFDHIGWASVDSVPVFPNATYRCHEDDWNYFTGADYVDQVELLGPNATEYPADMFAQAKLSPIAPLLETWSGTTTIRPGLEVSDAAGHTPGTSFITLTSDGESAVFIGDIAHHQAEFVEPDFEFIAHMDAPRALRAQNDLAAQLATSGVPFAAAHFRNFDWGRILRTDAGLQWQAIDDAVA